MKQEKDKRNQHHASESDPQKSMEAGKKGGAPASQVRNQVNAGNTQNQAGSKNPGRKTD
ncbi:hypothetical protein [Pontibacter vulgaris]|uniref:hypothetical protein n=1 Tax=Pontibacter vulgaris TaxID=2905679 RepID=UPI001FA76BC0|nr:hypothetical protein [Pontibacter vulgaris]